MNLPGKNLPVQNPGAGFQQHLPGLNHHYMRWLFFLSRVAFICNICFLIGFTLKISNWVHNQDLAGTVVIIGFFLVVLFNPLVNLCYLVLFLFRKKFWQVVPVWLITANILFLVMQIFYILYLNDTQPTQG